MRTMTKPDIAGYESMTQGDFNRHLRRIMADTSPHDLLQIPGVYEILAEHFNNEVLDSWDAEQERKSRDQEFSPGEKVLLVHEGVGCYPDTPVIVIEKMVDEPEVCRVCGNRWQGYREPDYWRSHPSYLVQFETGARGIIPVRRIKKKED